MNSNKFASIPRSIGNETLNNTTSFVRQGNQGGLLKGALKFQYEFSPQNAQMNGTNNNQTLKNKTNFLENNSNRFQDTFLSSNGQGFWKREQRKQKQKQKQTKQIPPSIQNNSLQMLAANFFSFLDNPGYKRNFQISPKIIRQS